MLPIVRGVQFLVWLFRQLQPTLCPEWQHNRYLRHVDVLYLHKAVSAAKEWARAYELNFVRDAGNYTHKNEEAEIVEIVVD